MGDLENKRKAKGLPTKKKTRKKKIKEHTAKVKQVLHLPTEIRRTNTVCECVSRCLSDVISCVIDEIISFSRFVLSWTVETCPKSSLSSSFATHLDFFTIIVWSLLSHQTKNKTSKVVPTPRAASMSHTRACPPHATFKLHVEALSQRVSQFCKLGSYKYIVGVESGFVSWAEIYSVGSDTEREIVKALWLVSEGERTPNQISQSTRWKFCICFKVRVPNQKFMAHPLLFSLKYVLIKENINKDSKMHPKNELL